MTALLSLALVFFIFSFVNAEIPRACSTPDTDKYPFCDTKLSLDDRINNLISLIHVEEKPPLLTARMSPGGGIPRIGLPAYDWGANCIHGVQSRCGTRCPTSFANPCGLGATYNFTGIKNMASIIGVELRSLWLQGVGENHPNNLPAIGLDCWSPNININRDPRWGRNQEVPSEDPYLTGQFGIAYTKGLQEGQDPRYLQGISTLKHWAAYSLEDYKGVTRHSFNAIVNPYDLANTYFPAWKASVVEGKAKGVMCSYNALNGIPTCASQFLNTTLRGEYGFEGYVTSDTGAVEDIYAQHKYVSTPQDAAAVAIKAGTDVNSGNVYQKSLITALNQGLVKESDIDKALYNTFKMRFELGLFDPIADQPYWHVPPEAVDTPQSQAANMLLTQETLVLLKNEKNTLPFPKGKKLAVLGPHGNATGVMVGNYIGQICPDQGYSCVVSPYLALQKDNSGGTTTYVQGCPVTGNSTSGFAEAFAAAQAADHVVLILGIDQAVEGESHDRVSITLTGVQQEFAQRVIALGKPTAVVFINGGSLDLTWFKQNADAVIEAWYPGTLGGRAISSVIFGDYNPGGKLPVTFFDSDYVSQVDFGDMSMTKAPGRTYRYYTGKPVYEFGYGLSYTTFKLTWSLNSRKSSVLSTASRDQVTYTVQVTNTGKIKGDEVVLAFFSPNNTGPLIKQLFGFQRITLNPGETQTLTFEMNVNTVAIGDDKGHLVTSPGNYNIVFTNGVDEKLVAKLEVVGQPHIVEKFPFNY